MKLSAPDGSWWVEMRGVNELNGGDFKTLQRIDDKLNGLENGVWVGAGDDEFELAPDGVTMVKREPRRLVSRETIDGTTDTMLARLMTNWSLADVLPMPYQPGYLYRDEVPLELGEMVRDALDEVSDRLRSGGPKGTPETSADSASTSPEGSTAPLPE